MHYAGVENMVEKLENTNKAEADTETYKASCCSDKGCEGHGNLPLDVGVVGVFEVDFYHGDVLLGILLNEVLYVGIHLIGWLLIWVADVAKAGSLISHETCNFIAQVLVFVVPVF